MSWIEELFNTYENCSTLDELMTPPFHMRNNTHIEIILDGDGNFIDANLEDLKNTVIPCTEKSEAARTMNPPSHPLCDKIQFIAKDYNGPKTSYHNKYIELLGIWANSEHTHPMVKAIYKYVQKGTVIADLLGTNKQIIVDNEDPADLFVRWKVEIQGVDESRCWKCKPLFESWQNFYATQDAIKDICMVAGKLSPLALNHPKKIRHSGDGAKLISSNDRSGYTFRGRFLTDEVIIDGKKEEIATQSATISADVSQKAHRALSWLINRQSFRNGDQVIVSWAVSGKKTPDAFAGTPSIFDETDEEKIQEITTTIYSDAGQRFARKLSARIAGYKADMGNSEKIIVMGLDSAGPGRLSITYYRELTGSDFLERIENWHREMAWFFREFIQDPIDKKKKHAGNLVFAPAPRVIAEACYGTKRDKDFEKFKRSVVERLLPCIVDGRNVPIDLVFTAIKRVSNRLAYRENEQWQWEQALSIACALYSCYQIRNSNNKNNKIMALENERTDRDYLYGRLLAVAEHLEETALYAANEKRETTAARLMQRFADFPFPTWRNIESALVPYKSRLQANRPSVLYKMKGLLDEIHSKFLPGDYEKDGRLSGAYLLGYHCQRLELAYKKPEAEATEKE